MYCQRSRAAWVRALGAVVVLTVFIGLLGLAPTVGADCPGNVLLNGSFEDGYSSRGAGEVTIANGWSPWWQDGPFAEQGLNRRPEFQPEDAGRFGRRRIHDGNWAQKWGNTFATHRAGLLQQVNVPAGSDLTLKVWAQSWSSKGDDPSVSDGGRYFLSVGIDPTGGTDFSSPNVVWSSRDITMDNWVQLAVQAKAKAGTVTVYLRGEAEFRLAHNDAYFDEACLTVVAPPPPPTRVPPPPSTPTQTALPTATATATVAPTPVPTATPVPGTIKVLAFDDVNGNGVRDAGEPLIAGAQIELSNVRRTPLASRKTDGVSEPYAFSGLPADTYILTEVDPLGYTSVEPNLWSAALLPGVQLEIAFADRAVPTPTTVATARPTTAPTVIAPSSTTVVTRLVTTVAPTATAARVEAQPPRPVDGGLSSISGILLLVAAVATPFAWRWVRARVDRAN